MVIYLLFINITEVLSLDICCMLSISWVTQVKWIFENIVPDADRTQ